MHTPGSEDYKDDGVTAAAIVGKSVATGLDVIAITDHDSGAWVDEVVVAAGGHPLTVLPGVEVTTHDRIHLLLIGDGDRSGKHIDDLLARIGIPHEARGTKAARSSQTIEDILQLASSEGWLCVAAHADAVPTEQNPSRGALMAALDDDRQRRMTILDSSRLVAAEVIGADDETLSELRGAGHMNRTRRAPGLALVRFSDAHRLDEIGRRSTWIKMTRPDREGLALALSDGDRSVEQHVDGLDPNWVPSRAIERLTIRELKYAGRGGADLEISFNPWLNVIIGGRGAGKSTLVNALRLALDRADEALTGDFERFNKVGARDADGALTDKTWLAVDYRRDDHPLRAGWSSDAAAPPLQEPVDDGTWKTVQGSVSQRTPARIIGQGELAQLAADATRLLSLVDDTPAVDRRSWQATWDAEHARLLSLRARAREQRSRIPDRSQLLGEQTDLLRAIEVLERDEHRETLRAYQRVSRQEAALDGWQRSIEKNITLLREAIADAAIDDPPLPHFDRDDGTDPVVRLELEQRAESLQVALAATGNAVEALASVADGVYSSARPTAWTAHRDAVKGAYQALSDELAGSGADPSRYGDLVTRRQSVDARLASIDSMEEEAARLDADGEAALAALHALRQKLTDRRRQFLASTAGTNAIVRFELVEAGEAEAIGSELRELLLGDAGGDAHEPDIERCTAIVREAADGLNGAAALKREIRSVAAGGDRGFRGWFLNRIMGLKPEALDRLDAWFPADRLVAEYRNANGTWQPISQGSAGQRNAAILAFLLSYGEEPLVIDQPENDLDNALITDLIVQQLREIRKRRQLIIVTHNPNIVVNADADLVISLSFSGGQIAVSEIGGLQEQRVRDEICRIVEGGREAFESRYLRIGERHV